LHKHILPMVVTIFKPLPQFHQIVILLANSKASLILSANPVHCKHEKRIRQQYLLQALQVLQVLQVRQVRQNRSLPRLPRKPGTTSWGILSQLLSTPHCFIHHLI